MCLYVLGHGVCVGVCGCGCGSVDLSPRSVCIWKGGVNPVHVHVCVCVCVCVCVSITKV